MSSRSVSAGDTMSQGDTVGFVGSTGWSTGNHIHQIALQHGAELSFSSQPGKGTTAAMIFTTP